MKFGTSLLALSVVGSSAATAQQGDPVVMPGGSVDSARAATATRNDSSGYNSAVGNLGQRGTKGVPVPATPADIRPGSPLRDIKGEPIARIDAVDSNGVIVNTGTTRVRLPLNAFGKDELGLLLGITESKFRSLVTKVTAANSGG